MTLGKLTKNIFAYLVFGFFFASVGFRVFDRDTWNQHMDNAFEAAPWLFGVVFILVAYWCLKDAADGDNVSYNYIGAVMSLGGFVHVIYHYITV